MTLSGWTVLEFERYLSILRKTLSVKMMELQNIVSMSLHEETVVEESSSIEAVIREPLSTIMEDEDSYLIIVDMPGCDPGSLTVNAYSTTVNVRSKSSVVEGLVYEKKLRLPSDADVSKLEYRLERGRLFIRVPRQKQH